MNIIWNVTLFITLKGDGDSAEGVSWVAGGKVIRILFKLVEFHSSNSVAKFFKKISLKLIHLKFMIQKAHISKNS